MAELWLIDLVEQRAVLASETLLRVPYTPFPLTLTARNIVWSPERPALYFLAGRQPEGADVWIVVPTPGRPVDVQQVTRIAEDRAVLSDVKVSSDGRLVSYLLRSDGRAVSELHVVDITRKDDSAEFSEKAGFLLACPGWTSAGEVVILRTDAGHTLTDVLLVKAGRQREVRRLRDVTRGSAALDSHRRVLYFAREGLAYGLYALSLDTGQVRQVFGAEPNGPAFSGVRVLGDGRLLFSLQSQNHDILSSEFGK